MNIFYSTKFAKEYKRLPLPIKVIAEERELYFRKDPFNAKLKTHKLTGKLKGFWAFSIDRKTRIIFEFIDKNTVHFHSVGSHQIYR